MKNIITLLFICAFTICSFSQMRFAFELTPINSNILKPTADYATAQNKSTFAGKLVVEKPLSDQEYKAAFFSTGLEVAAYKNEISYAAGALDTAIFSQPFTIEAKALFLTVPLTLKLRTSQYGLFTPFGQLGFEPTIVFKENISATNDINDAIAAEQFGFGVEAFNFPVSLAAGTELHISEENAAYASIFYKIGLSNMINDKFLDGGKLKGDDEAMHLNNVGLRIGFLF